MQTFQSFLTEKLDTEEDISDILQEDITGNDLNHARGVHAEVEMGRLLNGGTHMEHFRNKETQLTPLEAHKVHGNLLKLHDPVEHTKVLGLLHQAHDQLRTYLDKHKILSKDQNLKKHVFWTSNGKNDVEKVTGEKGSKTRADLMIRHPTQKDHHIGISMKVGHNPSNSGSGLKTLSSTHNVSQTILQKDSDSHQKHIDLIMAPHYDAPNMVIKDKKMKYKEALKGTLGTTAQTTARKAAEANSGYKSDLAKKLADGFNNHPGGHLGRMEALRTVLGAEVTKHPEVKVHIDPDKNQVHISSPTEDFKKLLKNTKSIKARASSTNVIYSAVTSKGTHDIAHLSIKNQSGPHTTINGNGKTRPGMQKVLNGE